MRDYEVVIILQPDIEEEDRAKLIEKLEGWMSPEDEKSESFEADQWGIRSLAYPIRKYKEGYYIFYSAKLDPTHISEMERNFTYQDEILRHLTVRLAT